MIALFFLAAFVFLLVGFYMKTERFIHSLGKNVLLGKIASYGVISFGVLSLFCAIFLLLAPDLANVIALVYMVFIILAFSLGIIILGVKGDSK